jgi:outer membrane protein OmpA-like peptidoglycan-associated protein
MREEAEKKLSAALSSLDVKKEDRGVVITLSGSVLFATGKYHLLPAAQQKLDEVAKALLAQGFKEIIVEGHSDSRGSADSNQALSLNRARAVREYLVGNGITATQITARGMGETRPVASNNTPDGRANNRRVELIVIPK